MVIQLKEQNIFFFLVCGMNSESRNLLDITSFKSSSTDMS